MCGPGQIAVWLAKARKVRRGREPEPEIMVEVLMATAAELTCPQCGNPGLTATPADENADDWPEAKVCESCSKPIPPDRLAAVPGATLCVACQEDEELGHTKAEIGYCPRCGAPMELRLGKSGGLTRYVPTCMGNPPCRR